MSIKLIYRKLNKHDLQKVSELVWRVFEEFEAPEYSDEGIENFKSFIQVEQLINNFNSGNMEFYGCLLEETLIGVISVRQFNHISLMFVDKEFHRKGIARNLFELLRNNLAIKCQGEKIITVNSSPYAVEIYQHLGFEAMDKEQIKDGIRFTPMRYEKFE